jgi:transcriptional regulator with XRE-family HTH domain
MASLRKRFGERIRVLRKAAGFSQEAFADASGFARSYMSRIERGAGNPSLDAIESLAGALKVPAQALFSDDSAAQAAGKRGRSGKKAAKR